MINLFEPFIAPTAGDLVKQRVDSSYINQGSGVEQFENTLSNFINNPFVLALNSCTSALHLALILANVGPGDEVVIPSQTFIATGTAVLMTGATPVFADIGIDSGTVSSESIRSCLTNKTKAIIAVHWAGYPADMKSIWDAYKDKYIIIEDGAQAFGTIYNDSYIGSNAYSHFCCLSFQATKHITCGDGGLLCCKNEDTWQLGKKLRWFGENKDNKIDRFSNVGVLGYKYNMNDIAATVGQANMYYAEEIITIRNARSKIYQDFFQENQNKKIKPVISKNRINTVPCYWFFPVLVDNRETFIKYMHSNEVFISKVDTGIHLNPLFNKYNIHNLDIQKIFDIQHVGLPVHPNLSAEDIYKIINLIKAYVG